MNAPQQDKRKDPELVKLRIAKRKATTARRKEMRSLVATLKINTNKLSKEDIRKIMCEV